MCILCKEFTHLHVHTDGSSLDGLGTVERLVSQAANLGFVALAMTDHGTLKNTLSFMATCKNHGIKPIVGLEAYVTHEGSRHHLTLLADGNKGFSTLVKLNNMGVNSSDSARPSFELTQLLARNEGVYVLSGCPASVFQEAEFSDAKKLLAEFVKKMPGRVFAEGMMVGSDHVFERAVQLSKDLKIPLVTTNDVHFPFKDDARIQKILTRLTAGFEYQNEDLFLATPEQIWERRSRIDVSLQENIRIGMKNAGRLASKLDVVQLNPSPKLPEIPNSFDEIKAIVEDTFSKYSATMDEEKISVYRERIEYEMGVIGSMGFSSYFYILVDIIKHAKSNGIWVGPGRGSGAGSLVLFLLGITEIDPIIYRLSFDRFLNYHRYEMPDVDVDISSIERHIVVDYATRKWAAMPVATYSRYQEKSLIHDLGRVFNAPKELHNAAAEEGPDGPAFEKMCSMYGRFFRDCYNAMIGQIRHTGQHAGGVVIADENFPTPLERVKGGATVVGWVEGQYRELSSVGLVKYDLLGLTSGSVLSSLEKKLGIHAPLPVDDDPVFSLFCEGKTLGIFQFTGSQGIIDFTMKVQPRTFEDLVAINALYRPGALDAGTVEKYPEWRKKPRKIHPLIDPILAPTFGVICYQEQFMEIFAKVSGKTMAEADLARKVLSKARPGQIEWEQKMAELKMLFFEGCKSSKIEDETAALIWSEITTHTRYSFNRSHSVAYAMVSWEMAWWKYHYPVEFFAAVLSYDTAKWAEYLYAVVESGVTIVPPDVNFSGREFVANDGKIYLPLSAVKFLGDAGVEAIIQNQPFASIEDFLEKVPKKSVNKRAKKGLYMLGAFESFGVEEKELTKKLSIEITDEDKEYSKQSIYEAYMGIFIPSPKFVELISRYNSMKDTYAGIITHAEKRKSDYGEYTVYHMNPKGSFWSRSENHLEVGDTVIVTVTSKTGKIKTIKRITENV